MANHEYTEKQLKIINGEIPIEAVDGRALTWLYKKALANNDKALIEKTLTWLSVSQIEAVNKRRARDRKRKSQQWHGNFQWKQPKSNEYTEHQKQIVRGEIPYEDVNTKELISIHMKAHNIGDFELSERLYDLITARRNNAIAKKDFNNSIYKKALSQINRSGFSFDNSYTTLTKLEQMILMGFVDLDDCKDEQLQHIFDIVKRENDTLGIEIINKLMLYKKDSEALYIVRNHREAVDMIEDLLGLPIRRPETWFTEDE